MQKSKKQLELELQQLNKIVAEQKKLQCEKSFYYFVQQAWSIVESSQFEDHWSIKLICDHAQAAIEGNPEVRKLGINCIPRLGKSIILSVMLPAWIWVVDPSKKILTVSHSARLTLDFSSKTRLILQSQWFIDNWGDLILASENTKGKIRSIHNGERTALTPATKTLGYGADIIITDDINDAENKDSAQITKVTDYYRDSLSTRFNNPAKGITIVVQQRLADNDITGYLKETDASFFFVILPLEFKNKLKFESPIGINDPRTKEGELLWPERFDQNFVITRKKNPFSYAAMYQQDPTPESGGIIKHEWLLTYNNLPRLNQFDEIVISIDLAIEIKSDNDYSVFSVIGKYDSHYYLIDIVRRKIEFYEQIDVANNLIDTYNPNKVLIENRGNANPLSTTLKRRIRQIELINPTKSKEERLLSVIHFFTSKLFRIPKKNGTESDEWIDETIKELVSFPKASHDDILDSIVQAFIYFNKSGSELIDTVIAQNEQPSIKEQIFENEQIDKIPCYEYIQYNNIGDADLSLSQQIGRFF